MKPLPWFLMVTAVLLCGTSFAFNRAQSRPGVFALQAADPVLVGAGDIAECNTTQDSATAALLDSIEGTVYTLGDNVYPAGTTTQFTDCYAPTWGRHKVRTRPAPGNHDYYTDGATGYYTYFGTAASPLETDCERDCKGYYSYDLGAWHIIVLNSEIAMSAGSAQEQWLRTDLAAYSNDCTLAYWHKPRFSSGQHGNAEGTQALWEALYAYQADVVLNGHDHNYERFAPQNPSGQADQTQGMRAFVVGTGGTDLRAFAAIQPNSEVRNDSTFGVLKLTLHPQSYDWVFVPIAGQTFTDVGSDTCVGRSTPTTTPTSTPSLPTPPSPTATPVPHLDDILLLSSTSSGTTDGVSFSDEDVLAYDTNRRLWAKQFDGSDVVTTTLDIDAVSRLSDGSLLLSFSTPSTIELLGLVDDSDIIRFIPTALGPTTLGQWEEYFDGSSVGLTTASEDIDAFTLLSDGRLVVSTVGAVHVTDIVGADEDLLIFTPTQLGTTTSGTWALYFDGSDVGLSENYTEDVNSVWIDPATSEIYLTTKGAFTVTNVIGTSADIFICAPSALGQDTGCTYRPYWTGTSHGFAHETIDALDIDKSAQEVASARLVAWHQTPPDTNGDDPQADPHEGPEDVVDEAGLGQQLFLPLVSR
jgi:hypothetical protein